MPHIFVSAEHGAFTPDGRIVAIVRGYSAQGSARDGGHSAADGAEILRLVVAHHPTDSVRVHVVDAAHISAETNARELAHWATQPDTFAPAYYDFPAEDMTGHYRRAFVPRMHSNCGSIGTADSATVKTWNGSVLGVITRARVYSHNSGSRMVALTVRGTNGALYYGRASWDNGNVIKLRRAK